MDRVEARDHLREKRALIEKRMRALESALISDAIVMIWDRVKALLPEAEPWDDRRFDEATLCLVYRLRCGFLARERLEDRTVWAYVPGRKNAHRIPLTPILEEADRSWKPDSEIQAHMREVYQAQQTIGWDAIEGLERIERDFEPFLFIEGMVRSPYQRVRFEEVTAKEYRV